LGVQPEQHVALVDLLPLAEAYLDHTAALRRAEDLATRAVEDLDGRGHGPHSTAGSHNQVRIRQRCPSQRRPQQGRQQHHGPVNNAWRTSLDRLAVLTACGQIANLSLQHGRSLSYVFTFSPSERSASCLSPPPRFGEGFFISSQPCPTRAACRRAGYGLPL